MNCATDWLPRIACLLVLGGILPACDARQWPLAEYQSGKPAARAWLDDAPGRSAANTVQSGSMKPASRKVETASVAMPGPQSGSSQASLIGLSLQQATDRLGPPHEEIEQAPAKLWRYRTSHCSLDVAFYPDVQTHVFRVLNYEVKGNDGTEQGRRKCIDGLRSGSLVR